MPEGVIHCLRPCGCRDLRPDESSQSDLELTKVNLDVWKVLESKKRYKPTEDNICAICILYWYYVGVQNPYNMYII